MRPHIAINATMLNDEAMTGLGVYTLNLLRELLPMLDRDDQVEEVRLLGDAERLKQLLGGLLESAKCEVEHLPTTNPIRRLIALNRSMRRAPSADRAVFYSPTHHGVLTGQLAQVITIHDLFALLFPGNYRLQHYYFKWYLPRVLSSTQVIITDSESTSKDIGRFYGTGTTLETVYAALATDLAAVTPEPVTACSGQRFFLFVGPSYSYKNCDRLIDAFVQLRKLPDMSDLKLVFVGGREPYKDFLRSHISNRASHLADAIVFLGHVSNDQLAWLYTQASAAMVTSLYEGFGLPALEAMHFGCPVIASNAGSLPEVCGEAALMVDPHKVTDIVSAMHRITVDEQLRSNLLDKGHDNLKRFGWKDTAARVYAILSRI